jgi:hypothetical protein
LEKEVANLEKQIESHYNLQRNNIVSTDSLSLPQFMTQEIPKPPPPPTINQYSKAQPIGNQILSPATDTNQKETLIKTLINTINVLDSTHLPLQESQNSDLLTQIQQGKQLRKTPENVNRGTSENISGFNTNMLNIAKQMDRRRQSLDVDCENDPKNQECEEEQDWSESEGGGFNWNIFNWILNK